jgi:NADP-dependent 3-hydroxy acid dehydrogenase YdfG
MERWKGKVALVTGASYGIGEATARDLAREGMKIVLTARSADRLEALRSELADDGAEVLIVPADLAKEGEIHRLFAEVRQAWGGVDVLINNAGLGLRGTYAEQDPQDWRTMLDINVFALSVCTQEALRDMESRPEGHIINVSSIAGHRVPPGSDNPYYSATKHAVKAITDGLRTELVARKSKVRVAMISPGMVETNFHEVATGGAGDSAAHYSRYRVLDAADVSDVIVYMLSTPPHVAIHDVVMRSNEQVN